MVTSTFLHENARQKRKQKSRQHCCTRHFFFRYMMFNSLVQQTCQTFSSWEEVFILMMLSETFYTTYCVTMFMIVVEVWAGFADTSSGFVPSQQAWIGAINTLLKHPLLDVAINAKVVLTITHLCYCIIYVTVSDFIDIKRPLSVYLHQASEAVSWLISHLLRLLVAGLHCI